MDGRAEAGSDARRRILEATRTLLETKSSQFFKVRDIAAMAKVSPALIMRYFNSKDELVFQAVISDMNEISTSKLLRWVETVNNLSVEDFLLQLFRQDLASGHRVRDLLTMQWWWTTVEEDIHQKAIAHRTDILLDTLLRTHGLPLDTDDETLKTIVRTLGLVYADSLRRAGMMRWTPEDALKDMLATAQPLLESFARQCETLQTQGRSEGV